MVAMPVIDFGDQTCAGDLIPLMENAIRLIQPGETIQVIARDPILAIDIAAWCSKSGNKLACLPNAKAGEYLIQKM